MKHASALLPVAALTLAGGCGTKSGSHPSESRPQQGALDASVTEPGFEPSEPSPQQSVWDASAADSCVACEDAWAWLISESDPLPAFAVVLTAEDVKAVLGTEVRLVALDPPTLSVIAQTRSTGESIIVQRFWHLGDGEVPSVYRLPEASRHLHFVAAWEEDYYLSCDTNECVLFEVDDREVGTLRVISGGTVPNGASYDSIALYQPYLCVAGADPVAQCFDREEWSAQDAATVMQYAWPRKAASDEPLTCDVSSEEVGALVRWQVGEDGTSLMGTTADGRIVTGARQSSTTCCCPRTAPLGTPVAFVMRYCGAAANAMLLTENALYGSDWCVLTE